MVENYHKWYSQWLGEDFEILVFGHSGIPLILFPQSNALYYDFKDYGVIASLTDYIEAGELKVYCLSSYDRSSWMNYDIEPYKRVECYKAFEETILHDVVGFANYETEKEKMILAGFGFGGYNALNISLKHPEVSRGIITIGSSFDIKRFIYGHFDDEVYFNSPLDYLSKLNDESYISKFREMKIVLSSGSQDESFIENKAVSKVLFEKEINHYFDVYDGKLNTYEHCKRILNDNLPFFFSKPL